jgi:predicted TIM-barrel fold metal-dependent hydrolase
LNSLKLPYVFDHVAHAEPHQNKNSREFGELLAILKNEEHACINLYSFYQLSEVGPPDYSDMIEVVGAIVEARPDRVIWGSNWPHGGIAVPMPNDGDLLDFLLSAVWDETIRKQILSDNPAPALRLDDVLAKIRRIWPLNGKLGSLKADRCQTGLPNRFAAGDNFNRLKDRRITRRQI